MANRLALPTLYVILDAALLPSDPIELTKSLLSAGARQFQYRNKTSSSRELLHASQALCLTVRQQGGMFVVMIGGHRAARWRDRCASWSE